MDNLSLQKADRSCCSVWACGMLTKELLQNPMMGHLAVICTTNGVENEQDWKGVQFVSTTAVLIVCNIFLIYM